METADPDDTPDTATCSTGFVAGCPPAAFGVDADFVFENSERFDVEGAVCLPGKPGNLPRELAVTTSPPDEVAARIAADLADIRAWEVDTVRLWGVRACAYEALRSLGGPNILQTIWLDGSASEFHDAAFETQSESYIRDVVDSVYAPARKTIRPSSPSWSAASRVIRASCRQTARIRTSRLSLAITSPRRTSTRVRPSPPKWRRERFTRLNDGGLAGATGWQPRSALIGPVSARPDGFAPHRRP